MSKKRKIKIMVDRDLSHFKPAITYDEKLYMMFQKRKGGRPYYCISEDDGKTWSESKLVQERDAKV